MSHFAGKTKRKNDLEIKTYRLNVLPAIFKLIAQKQVSKRNLLYSEYD